MFLCLIRVLEWIYTLKPTECQGIPGSKQVQYLKFKLLQRHSNPQQLSFLTNTEPFSQTDRFGEIVEFSFTN